MDSSERRRLNRLLRKPNPPSLTKSLRSKFFRSNSKQNKHNAQYSDKQGKNELNIDIACLCAEMCGVANITVEAATVLQKHLNQVTRLLIHQVIRVMEQSRRGLPQASDIDLASVLIGLEVILFFCVKHHGIGRFLQ